MKYRFFHSVLILLLLVFFTATMEHGIRERSKASLLSESVCEEMNFREQYMPEKVFREIAREENMWEVFTVTMLKERFYPGQSDGESEVYKKYKKEEFYKLCNIYETIWGDVKCFPLPENRESFHKQFFYENTFGEERTYGGERIHEGTDIFGKKNLAGYYPVISMTEGTVENIGWLPLGGYRIGIRAPRGAYFYYAHLSEYGREFSQGDKVKAGEILGYMGNSGYGEVGTTGKFPVHLHLGIYIKTPHYKELSVNPYWILKEHEKNIRKYTY